MVAVAGGLETDPDRTRAAVAEDRAAAFAHRITGRLIVVPVDHLLGSQQDPATVGKCRFRRLDPVPERGRPFRVVFRDRLFQGVGGDGAPGFPWLPSTGALRAQSRS